MTQGDLVKALQVGVMRDDLEQAGMYSIYINIANRAIQQDRSWFCMRDGEQVTIPSGGCTASLPDNFKELTPAKPPVFVLNTVGGPPFACTITTPEQIAKYGRGTELPLFLDLVNVAVPAGPSGPSGASGPSGPSYVKTWTINTVGPASQALTLCVSYYGFLPDLTQAADTNYLLTNYAEMFKAKVKAVAFEDINDPAAVSWENVYEIKKTKAAMDDARRVLSGMNLRMGG
jgi:hypothetical protein